MSSGRSAVSFGSNCRRLPAAALRGFTNVFSPIYLARQMFDIQHGARGGANVALMQGVVANLTHDDVLNISAYLGSLAP